MSSHVAIAGIIATALTVSACSNDPFTSNRSNAFGANELVNPDALEEIDLARLIASKAAKTLKNGGTTEPTGDDAPKTTHEALLDAVKNFENVGTRTEQKRRRNEIQSFIVAASNQRCGDYKRLVKALDARANFVLGGLTTAAAAAGAISTAQSTVRALSGTAAFLSGARAEFNESYFANQTIQVLTDGFETKRAELLGDMKQRQTDSILSYPLNAAWGDALVYHDNCSLVAGLEVAAKSITRASDPGVKQMIKLEQNLIQLRAQTGLKLQQAELDAQTVALDRAVAANAATSVTDGIKAKIEVATVERDRLQALAVSNTNAKADAEPEVKKSETETPDDNAEESTDRTVETAPLPKKN